MMEILPIEKVRPSKLNPRRSVGDLTEMVTSVKAVGILEPLLVVPSNGGYELVAGERRLAAAKKAGLAEVPAIVKEGLSEGDIVELMVVENLQREDLTPREEASAYKVLVNHEYSQRQIAERVGRTQAHVSRRLALLELPAQALEALDTGGITVADAVELTKLTEMPKRLLAAMKQGTGRGWRDVGEAVRVQLEEHEHAVRRGEVLRELKAKGVKTVASDGLHWSNYHSKEKEIGSGYDDVHVDPKKHESESCHRVGILLDGSTVPLCANPARHAKKDGKSGVKTGLSETEKKKRRAKIAHNRARREAAEERGKFVGGFLGKRVSAGDGMALLLDAFLHHKYGEDSAATLACELLGLEVKGSGRHAGTAYVGPGTRTIEAFAAKSPANLARAVAAVAIASREAELGVDHPGFAFEKSVGYFGLLKRFGYKVSKAEQLELTRKAPR